MYNSKMMAINHESKYSSNLLKRTITKIDCVLLSIQMAVFPLVHHVVTLLAKISPLSLAWEWNQQHPTVFCRFGKQCFSPLFQAMGWILFL
jgi:hypothetical protein